jgi:Domain of unknown function (DUF4129)
MSQDRPQGAPEPSGAPGAGGAPGARGAPGSSGAPGWRGARVALAACLLALIAVGLRGAVSSPALDGPFLHHSLVDGAVLEGVLACLLIELIVRHIRAPRDALLAARLRKLLTYVVVGAMVVIPIGYLPLNQLKGKRPAPQPPQGSKKPLKLPHVHPGGTPTAVVIVLIILGAIAAAALIYLIARYARIPYLGRRLRRSPPVDVPAEADDSDDEADLREAVESGQSALRRLDDTRAAIIACYAAMERSLARAGAVRAAADTPDELLARAVGQGLVSGDAAGRLTVLFYEARFSSHPMPPARRDDAERALDELAATLGDPEPANVSGAVR